MEAHGSSVVIGGYEPSASDAQVETLAKRGQLKCHTICVKEVEVFRIKDKPRYIATLGLGRDQ